MKIICHICLKELKSITNTHLKLHSLSVDEYKKLFPNSELYSHEIRYTASDRMFKQIETLGHPAKGHIVSDETKRLQSESHKGISKSEEHKKKISLSLLGEKSPNFGKHRSPEIRKKISEGNKKKIISDETKEKISKANIGLQIGEKNPFFGKHHTEETKNIISKKNKVRLKGIPKSKEWKLKISGKNNYNWKGGISKEPYSFEFNEELKNDIKQRDDCTCQKCNKRNGIDSQNLTVHHVDYNKKNCKYNNLISLCSSCNSKVNFNREYWTEYFTDLINEKFSLKRHFEGDI